MNAHQRRKKRRSILRVEKTALIKALKAEGRTQSQIEEAVKHRVEQLKKETQIESDTSTEANQ